MSTSSTATGCACAMCRRRSARSAVSTPSSNKALSIQRRRLFEDAADISVFEGRKADATRKLRETATNLERCADVLAELEPRLRSLKRQAGLARSHRELTEELRGLLIQHYAVLWRNARQGLAEAAAAEQ